MYPIELEYKNDSELKREDVNNLLMWVESQLHLPQITELEALWFLKSCYYSNEKAKRIMDNFYSMRTHDREMFHAMTEGEIKENSKIVIMWFLSEKTVDGDSILFIRLQEKDASNFDLLRQIRSTDCIILLQLLLHGTHTGLRLVLDVENITIGILAKLGITTVRRGLAYLQEAIPIRLKGIHFININPILEAIISICKPFLHKEIYEMIYCHQTLEDFSKYIPLDILPMDYGGKDYAIEKIESLMVKRISENLDFFKHLDDQLVDESKRPGKPKNATDLFGVDGTFKKLELD
ncbi:hypothetical protein WA026_005112 [Henosepilachna vigintioctopunctata]|uniref:CRAL-TRIO domain-containing protein n=1 Tax=Henosepilachna vigintioctopunctata TaxID=420089 RepID=A0AAW1USY2_9CUCU